MNSNLKDNPLFYPILFWLIGLVLAKYIQIDYTITFIGFGIILLLLIFFSKKQFLLLILILFLAMLRFNIYNRVEDNHISYIFEKFNSFTQPVKGRIISGVKKKNGLASFTLELISIKQAPVSGRVQLYTKSDSITFGDVIEAVVNLKNVDGISNPYGFDYKEYLRSKKVYGSGFTKTPIKIIASKKSLIPELIVKLRAWITKRINRRFPKNSSFVKAVILGDKDELGEIQSSITKAGLSHLLAVSGLHVGVISMIIFTILSILIPWRSAVRIITILMLFIYAGLCNWSPSVFRAATMISLFLLGKILSKQVSVTNNLLLSALIISFIYPEQIFSIGFQLSFLAVYTLVEILPKYWSYIKNSIRHRLLYTTVQLITVTVVLSLYLGPVTMYYFNQFNLNGIVANLLGIPLIGLILPTAITMLIFPFEGFVLKLFSNSFQFLMMVFEFWVNLTSKLPFHFDFVNIIIWQLIIIYIILLLFPFYALGKWKRSMILFAGIILIFTPNVIFQDSSQLKCIFFDCGLGDMALIETPHGECIMVDCGPPGEASGSFSQSALPYLKKNGLKTIDYLFITHAHNDHYGGFDDLIDQCIVRNLVITDEFQERKIWDHFLELLSEKSTKLVTITDTCHFDFEAVKLKILHPDIDYCDDNINNVSIVIRLDYYDFSLLLNGDLEHEGEHYLLAKYSIFLPADVTKVGHHGSQTSSSNEYLERVDPSLAFIPAPIKNRFGFPHATTLDKYAYLNENLITAGNDGALIVTTNGKKAFYQTIKSKKYSSFDID